MYNSCVAVRLDTATSTMNAKVKMSVKKCAEMNESLRKQSWWRVALFLTSGTLQWGLRLLPSGAAAFLSRSPSGLQEYL